MNSFVKKFLTFYCILFFMLASCSSNNGNSNAGNDPHPPPQKTSSDNSEQPVATPPKNTEEIEFQKLGIIREFGGTDNAAMFGLLPKSGKLKIDKIEGPVFLKTYAIGELNQTTINKIFLNSSKPLNTEERQNLISEFNGAIVIYTEGYSGNLCSNDEITFTIKVTGRLDNTDIEVTFQFEAISNPDGNCKFHMFGIITKS